MATLYPSWIEIPAADLERATRFYRAVFGLDDTPLVEDYPPAKIVVLLPSQKEVRAPGVSLIHTPGHAPCAGGARVNFHLASHAEFSRALAQAAQHGGTLQGEIVDDGDGTRYINLLDSEGNGIAVSSYEAVE